MKTRSKGPADDTGRELRELRRSRHRDSLSSSAASTPASSKRHHQRAAKAMTSIDDLTVAELRARLRKEGLSATGIKAALQARLREHLDTSQVSALSVPLTPVSGASSFSHLNSPLSGISSPQPHINHSDEEEGEEGEEGEQEQEHEATAAGTDGEAKSSQEMGHISSPAVSSISLRTPESASTNAEFSVSLDIIEESEESADLVDGNMPGGEDHIDLAGQFSSDEGDHTDKEEDPLATPRPAVHVSVQEADEEEEEVVVEAEATEAETLHVYEKPSMEVTVSGAKSDNLAQPTHAVVVGTTETKSTASSETTPPPAPAPLLLHNSWNVPVSVSIPASTAEAAPAPVSVVPVPIPAPAPVAAPEVPVQVPAPVPAPAPIAAPLPVSAMEEVQQHEVAHEPTAEEKTMEEEKVVEEVEVEPSKQFMAEEEEKVQEEEEEEEKEETLEERNKKTPDPLGTVYGPWVPVVRVDDADEQEEGEAGVNGNPAGMDLGEDEGAAAGEDEEDAAGEAESEQEQQQEEQQQQQQQPLSKNARKRLEKLEKREKQKQAAKGEKRHLKRAFEADEAFDPKTTIPKRGRQGPKDYVPDGSSEQAQRVASALGEHHAWWSLQRSSSLKTLCIGEWLPSQGLVLVRSPKGTHLQALGQTDRATGGTLLCPEEALFLIDRGNLEIFYNGYPLSVQESWALLMADGSVTVDHFVTYAYLKRLGYNVLRHKDKQGSRKALGASAAAGPSAASPVATTTTSAAPPPPVPKKRSFILSALSGLVDRVMEVVTPAWNDEPAQPLLPQDLRADESKSLDALRVVPAVQLKDLPPAPAGSPRLRIDYDVFRPNFHFRKTAPGTPHYCVSVCKFTDAVPSPAEIQSLGKAAGGVDVKFAVVDHGTVIFHALMDMKMPVYRPARDDRPL